MENIYDLKTNACGTRHNRDPYEDLANAIIMQAVNDYRMLQSGRIPTISEEQQLNMKPESVIKTVYSQKEQLVKFFKSTWYADLTNVSATYLLERLNAEPYRHWKPTHKYVEVSAERLEREIKKRNLGVSMLYKLTGVKGDYFVSIVKSKRVIIPVNRAKKIMNGLGISEREFIVRKIMRGE